MSPTVRNCIDGINRLFLWLKQNQRVKVRSEPMKVNLGSGLTVTQGWLNVDSSLNALISNCPAFVVGLFYDLTSSRTWYTREEYVRLIKGHTFIHHDLKFRLPFPDDSVDYFFTSHVIEHLFRVDAEGLLRECLRCLKSSGRIRVCVPDLATAVAEYLSGNKDRALDLFFTRSKEGYYSRHQYMYDFQMLVEMMKSIGFKDIQRFSFQHGLVPDVDKLDNRPDHTLFVEAAKQSRTENET